MNPFGEETKIHTLSHLPAYLHMLKIFLEGHPQETITSGYFWEKRVKREITEILLSLYILLDCSPF